MRQLIFVLFLVFIINTIACSKEVAFTENLTDQERLSGTYFTEDFTQGYSGNKLDILVVVDNSGSMAEEQTKLGDRIDNFLSTLYDVDWQVGITTTDVSDGTYGLKGSLLDFSSLNSHILRPSSANYQSVFKQTVVRPETGNCTDCPSGNEQPLAAAIMAMEKRSSDNRGFFRHDADLGILILSDEDEMSNGPIEATQAEEVVNKFKTIWGDGKRLSMYGMIIKPGDSNCFNANGGNGNYGDILQNFADITGGLTGSICETDYAPSLSIIGEHARKLIQGVRLQFYPDETSISINFQPAHNTAWTLSGKNIIFDVPPPKDTKIIITYMVL